MILGPTEHRVARWLADRTGSGRITIRTVDLAAATHVERSEAYRITRRLRILGLFGIENDRAGTKGGRRYWRTTTPHDGAELVAASHRVAWSRVVGWAQARRARVEAVLGSIRAHHTRRPTPVLHRGSTPTSPPGSRPVSPHRPADPGGGVTFLDRLVRGGLSAALASDFSRGVQ